MWKLRLTCLAYTALLTLLLLTPNPTAPVGIRSVPDIGVHFAAFAVLGMLVAASRFPLRGVLLAGVLLVYAVGVELMQSLFPPRSVEARDLLENLLGLLAGVVVWRLAANYRVVARRDATPEKKQFRVLTMEGLVTYDTFVLADEQPPSIKADCLLIVHQLSGRTFTVHRARLVPLDEPGNLALDRRRSSPCLKCGKVGGTVEDQVVCSHPGQDGCALLETRPEK